MKVATENDGKTTVERLSKQETRTFANAKSIMSQVSWHEDPNSDLGIKAAEIADGLEYVLNVFAKRKIEESRLLPDSKAEDAN